MNSVRSVIIFTAFGLLVSSAVYCAANYFEVNVMNKTGDVLIAASELEPKSYRIPNNEERSFKLWKEKVIEAEFAPLGHRVFIQAKSIPAKTPYLTIKKGGKVDARNFKVTTWIKK